MKVWRYCVVLALLETVALAAMVLYAMMRNGDGSGVWIPFLPLLWLALSLWFWVFHRLLAALMAPKDHRYTLLTLGIVLAIATAYSGGDWYTILRYGDLGVLTNLVALPVIAALMVRSHRNAVSP